MLVDRVLIRVRSGRGGDGCTAFRREKFVPRGGPSGGDGGRGGDVIVAVDPALHTLLDLRYRQHWHAEDGRPGEGATKTGKSGGDAVVPVPPGTLVRDVEAGELLGDLMQVGQTLLVARGGKGGLGNARFKSSINQAPTKSTPGGPYEERTLELELKLIADVGLVGLPNAGKSTLLAALSDARPKIGDYPFTTLEPNLGLVRTAPMRSLVMADVPGLIEGASAGRGLGKEFLRHVERCSALLVLVEATSEEPLAVYRSLLAELEAHALSLLEKPRLLVLSKLDLLGSADGPQRPVCLEPTVGYLAISAVSGLGLDALRRELDRFVPRVELPGEPGDSPIPLR